ncbi:MAG: response regulator transcription factor [Rhodocyclaceae bacterium]|nr:response regulator transcription factor [Rhodocyclaceae bacterium]
MLIHEDCLHHLYELKREIGWWHSSSGELSSKLGKMKEFSQRMKGQGGVYSQAANIILPKLESFQKEINEQNLNEFLEAAKKAQDILKNEPNKDDPGSFYNFLHSFRNIAQAVRSNSEHIRKIVERCLNSPREISSDDDTKLLIDLKGCFENIKGGITPQSIQAIEEMLNNWQRIIPTEIPRLQSSKRYYIPLTQIERVFIIEDQEIWSTSIGEIVAEELPNLKKDGIYCWKTYDEAKEKLNKISELWKTRRNRGEDERGESIRRENPYELQRVNREQREGILVILDLGLPKDEDQLKRGMSSRKYGKDLLQQLRSYGFNIRTILLTSHYDFLEDHRWAITNGIAPEDYIWKGAEDCEERIKSCIRRVIETERGVSKIEISEKDGQGSVIIDDVEIQLEPLYFRTFSVLCAQPLPISCEGILELLKTVYGHGTYNYDGYKPDSIHDHIYEIRKKIYEAFNRMGRLINPYLIIQTVETWGEKKYQIRRGIHKTYNNEEAKIAYTTSLFSILVVENNQIWCNQIKEFLDDLGYETIIAHSVEDSVKKAKEKNPALLCLDMHIPKTIGEWEENPDSGQMENGFEALEKIRETLKEDIGVAILTDHYEKGELRDEAIKRGIDINHWVGKDENWQSNLAYAVWRLTREFQLGTKTPPEDDIYSHLRIQLDESNRKRIYINDVEIKLTKNRSKLFWTLAESRTPVPRGNILSAVYGEDIKNKENALNLLVKNIRQTIEEALPPLNAKEIIFETPDGYKLRGSVFIKL